MTLVLDTNILIALERRQEWAIRGYQEAISSGEQLSVPSLVRYEARRGLLKAEFAPQLSLMDNLLAFIPVLDFDARCADIAADLYHHLRSAGILIEDADLLIAATAMRHGATLITRNTKHFKRISGLNLLDWQQEPQ